MRIGQKRYQVDRMNGWYEVTFREVGTKRRRTFNLDELVTLSDSKKKVRVQRPKRAVVKSRRRK
jgi:hypothetical protein